MLFTFFDPIEYTAKTLNKNAPTIQMTQIFKDYRTYFNTVSKGYKLQTYYITGAPRPEELAYQIYGNVQYYWVLLMTNNTYDPYHGWITSQDAAYKSAEQRYKDIGGEQVLYHVDAQNDKYYNLVEYPANSAIWYDKGDLQHRYPQYNGPLASVDIYEASILKNEKYREIKIIAPTDLDAFISDLMKAMEKGQ